MPFSGAIPDWPDLPMDPSPANAVVQDSGAPPAASKPGKRHLGLIVGVTATVVVAASVGVYLLMPGQVVVPDFRGDTLSNATAKLQSLHLVVGRKTFKGDPASAAIVVAQFPSPTTAVRTGSSVDLVLAEPAMTQVPSLIGKSIAIAQRRLADTGLQLGGIQWNARSRMARNTVLQQFPAAGTKVQAGSRVDLVASGVPQQVAQTAARSSAQRARLKTPSAPAPATNVAGQIANIAGSWRDAGGAVVRIVQNGTNLQYTAHSGVGNCQGNGVISGANFQTSYVCASVIGARTSGRCAGTVSGNGNMFRLQCLDSMMGRTNDTFTR